MEFVEKNIEWRALAHLKTALAFDLIFFTNYFNISLDTKEFFDVNYPSFKIGNNYDMVLFALPMASAYQDICCDGKHFNDFSPVVTENVIKDEYDKQKNIAQRNSIDMLTCLNGENVCE